MTRSRAQAELASYCQITEGFSDKQDEGDEREPDEWMLITGETDAQLPAFTSRVFRDGPTSWKSETAVCRMNINCVVRVSSKENKLMAVDVALRQHNNNPHSVL